MKGLNTPWQALDPGHVVAHSAPRGGVLSLHSLGNGPVRDQDGPASLVSFENKTETRLIEVEKIIKEEIPEGISPASWALAWCLKNKAVSAVIPGSKSPEQVISNASGADLLD